MAEPDARNAPPAGSPARLERPRRRPHRDSRNRSVIATAARAGPALCASLVQAMGAQWEADRVPPCNCSLHCFADRATPHSRAHAAHVARVAVREGNPESEEARWVLSSQESQPPRRGFPADWPCSKHHFLLPSATMPVELSPVPSLHLTR
jgi:hypothetical protein